MIRVLLIALIMASGATAWAQDNAPTIEVALDPSDPVTVGTPVEVAITVLVPTYMPDPPVWPDLQIADAITRLSDRATATVTRRIERKSWSGLRRTYEITPQRAADFSLNSAVVTVTFSDPDSHDPRQVDLPIPDVKISAVVPHGAEGLDPFIAARSLSLSAAIDGMPDDPKPGDAFTLTLTTTAIGTQAMLLPPLSDRIPTPQGLRAYPRQPDLIDAPGQNDDPPTATRTEKIAFMVEAPGSYVLPALNLDWWNTGSKSVETASIEPLRFEVNDTIGRKAIEAARSGNPFILLAGLLALVALIVGFVLLERWHRRDRTSQRPNERRLYRELQHAVRHEPIPAIRQRLRHWLAAQNAETGAEIDAALLSLERDAFGPAPQSTDSEERRRLFSAVREHRKALHHAKHCAEPSPPALNPDWTKIEAG